jgi:hypothetical protein
MDLSIRSNAKSWKFEFSYLLLTRNALVITEADDHPFCLRDPELKINHLPVLLAECRGLLRALLAGSSRTRHKKE